MFNRTIEPCAEDCISCVAPACLLRVALAAHVAGARPVPPVLAPAEAEPARLHAGVAVEGGPARTPAPVHRGVVALHLVGKVPRAHRGSSIVTKRCTFIVQRLECACQ